MSEKETGGDHGLEKESHTNLNKLSDVKLLVQKVNDVGQPIVQCKTLVSTEILTDESSTVANPLQVTKTDAITLQSSAIRKLPLIYDPRHEQNETIIFPTPIEPAPSKEFHDDMSLKPIPPEIEPGPSKRESLVDIEKPEDDTTNFKTLEMETAGTHRMAEEEEEDGLKLDSSLRSSRIFVEASKRLRNLVCCGVHYDAPSEDDVSYTKEYSSGI